MSDRTKANIWRAAAAASGPYLDEGVDVVHQSLSSPDDELVHTRDGVRPESREQRAGLQEDQLQ